MENQLDTLLKMTAEMVDLARSGEWEQLVPLEQRRGRLLREYYAADRLESLPPQARDAIEEIQRQDLKVMNLAQGARNEVVGHLGRMKQVKQINDAYGGV